jgi:hypothetical protein
VKFYRLFLAKCPLNLYQAVIEPTLQGLLVLYINRLTAMWAASQQQKDAAAAGSTGAAAAASSGPGVKKNQQQLELEILDDDELRELTRSSMYLFFDALGVSDSTKTASAADDIAHAAATSSRSSAIKLEDLENTKGYHLCRFIASRPHLYKPMLTLLAGCIHWPDNVSCQRASKVQAYIMLYVRACSSVTACSDAELARAKEVEAYVLGALMLSRTGFNAVRAFSWLHMYSHRRALLLTRACFSFPSSFLPLSPFLFYILVIDTAS